MAHHEKDDWRLDEYLRGDSTLTRAYREIGQESPPAALDAAILAQAKSAVAGTSPRGGKPRWFVPLSLVATVMLSVGVVLFMAREGAGPLPPEGTPVPETSPETKAPAVQPKSTVRPNDAPRFEPRVFTPKEMPVLKSPEQWLTEIEALRRAGKHAEAEAELIKLRQRYPDFPIDERPK